MFVCLFIDECQWVCLSSYTAGQLLAYEEGYRGGIW